LVISKNPKEELIVFTKARTDKEHFLEPWLYTKTSYITKNLKQEWMVFMQELAKNFVRTMVIY
jgi:hypothetical protein